MSGNNTNVPKIRFPGFTDAWEQRKLGDLAEVRTGKAFSSTDFKDDGEYLVVTNKNIQDKANGITSIGDRINISEDSILNNYLLSGDNILVTMDGVNIGKTGKYSNEKAVLAQRVGRLNSEQLEFVYQITSSNKFVSEMNKLSVGNAIKHISLKQISDYSFSAPISKEEQERIGTFFKHFDHLITLHRRKLKHLQDEKKSLLQKMFPKDGADVPEIRFPGFTHAWEQRKLGEVVDVRSGMDYKHLSEGTIPVYGTGGYMLSVNEALSYDEDAIGIGRKGTIDKPFVLKAPFWTVDTLFYAVPRQKYDLNFTFDIFQGIDWKKKDESTGVPSLSKTVINGIEVLFPNYNEQKVIGRLFRELDHLITLHQCKLNHLQEQKKSLLQQMFV